jgi:AcrR family transcriptional regulator
MNKNLTRKEKEQKLHKNLIIRASAQIFAEKGYEKTTLDEIAQIAEFSKGSLYNYFENKEDLFLTTLEVGINKLIEEMKKVEEDKIKVVDKIKSVLEIMITYFNNDSLFNKHRAFFQMLVNEKRVMACQASDEFLHRMQDMHKKMSQYFVSIFQNGIESNELKIGSAQTYAEIFLGIIHHYVFLVNIGFIKFDCDKSDQIFDVFFNGVKS